MFISLPWIIVLNVCVCETFMVNILYRGYFSSKICFHVLMAVGRLWKVPASMAPVSCHLPAREHMARDTLVWWKQTQQCQFTSDQQAKAQTQMKTLSHKAENVKNVMWWQMCILQAVKFHMTFSANTIKNKGFHKNGFSQWYHGGGTNVLVPQRIFRWNILKKKKKNLITKNILI